MKDNEYISRALRNTTAESQKVESVAIYACPADIPVRGDHRYSVFVKALREIAGNGDATGRNPQLMVDIAIRALKAEEDQR